MDQFRADLHIHSKFSRATSKKLSPVHLAAWARVKGLDVVATGDFTHSGWLAEIEEHLVQEESGLLRLKSEPDLDKEIPWLDGALPPGSPKFMLCTEISSIYKRGGKVRKIHNLVFLPSLERVRQFNARLAQIGNLESDGRPILGLDAKHLLEIVLETDPLAFLVPAHIWTPWFSLFGSKSGFDTIEECFGSLSKEIFALETGLSSDPDMNWMWSKLDRFRLISNSDAHSGENLGRESNLFSGTPSFEGIYRALRGEGLGQKFLGTVEFFPEEGKYHMDGHRKCNIVLDPRESLARGNICPGCGKPLTIGVLNRVLALADRELPERPAGHPGFFSLIPLPEILSEIVGTGPKTKKVLKEYQRLVAAHGSEISILQKTPLEELAKSSTPLAEGIRRMRSGKVRRHPGFDGQYGKISVFSGREQREFKQGMTLVPSALEKAPAEKSPGEEISAETPSPGPASEAPAYNEEQIRAIQAGPGPVLVLAGPGTGKTHTLMGRVRYLLEQDVSPRQILVLTFTRRAAGELKERLLRLLSQGEALPHADTLHALAFDNWTKTQGQAPVVMTEEEAFRLFAAANKDLPRTKIKQLWQKASALREQNRAFPEQCSACFEQYARMKNQFNLVDYADLLEFWLEQIRSNSYVRPYTHLLVDEIQDLSPLQLELVKSLAPRGGHGFFAIGDPNQSIYGFRGAVPDVVQNLKTAWDDLEQISLSENFRSTQNILEVAGSLFPDCSPLSPRREEQLEIHFFHGGTAAQEASWIGDRILSLLGGTGHWQADMGEEGEFNPGEIAVLVRFKALMPGLNQTLTRLGIPCGMPEKEAFWKEPRVKLILDSVGRMVGLHENGDESLLQCPDRILAQGPSGLAAYLGDIPPFDMLFWQSGPFLELKSHYVEQEGWIGLINWIHLQTEIEQVKARAEKVQIMTLHAAKGLEFEAVFLPALEDGILPFAGKELLSGKPRERDRMDEEEERRLFYVGLTRAKTRLYLSYADRRRIYGKLHQLRASRFLEHLPQETFRQTTMKARMVQKEKQLSLF